MHSLKCGQNTRGKSVACRCRTLLRVEICAGPSTRGREAASCRGSKDLNAFSSGGPAARLRSACQPTISTKSILSITFPHILNPLSHRYRRENCCHKRRDVPFLIMMLCVGPLNFTSFTTSHTSVRAFKRQCSNLTNLCGGTRERRKEWRERQFRFPW